jgi:hypothetical protein
MRTQPEDVGARRNARTKPRTTRKPGASTKNRSGSVKRQHSGLRKVLLGAFLIGVALGVFQTENPWHGTNIFANARLVFGYGLGLGLLMAIIWSLTAVRTWMAALIWRKRV